MRVSSNLGTPALEKFILALLVALKLDKNSDGKVTATEAFQSVSELAPQFFNIGAAMDEGKDLDAGEFQHLCNVAAANMPDYPNVRAEAETVVSAALEVIGAGAKLIVAVTRLNKSKVSADEAEKAPKAPAKDTSKEAKDEKMAGGK